MSDLVDKFIVESYVAGDGGMILTTDKGEKIHVEMEYTTFEKFYDNMTKVMHPKGITVNV